MHNQIKKCQKSRKRLTTSTGLDNENFRFPHQTFTVGVPKQQEYFVQWDTFAICSKDVSLLPVAQQADEASIRVVVLCPLGEVFELDDDLLNKHSTHCSK